MSEQNISDNIQNLSKEDLELLKKQLEQLEIDKDIDLSEYKYIFEQNQIRKQTDAKYEIYISLVANVLENIEGQDFPESRDICSNNYFIPVPSGQDHHEYLKAFFDHLQGCMSSSAEQSSEQESKNE